jgi:hypothetical protein
MTLQESARLIERETLLEGGAMWSIREGEIDEEGFSRLSEAIASFAEATREERELDRHVLACLFEVPWEIENTREHFLATKGEHAARQVSRTADEIRELIHAMLWGSSE